MWGIYTVGCHSVTEKTEIMPFAATQRELVPVKFSAKGQTEKNSYTLIPLIAGVQNNTHILTYKREQES